MWASENDQERFPHAVPQSPAAAPVSTLMTTCMSPGHAILLSAYSPRVFAKSRARALKKSKPARGRRFVCRYSMTVSRRVELSRIKWLHVYLGPEAPSRFSFKMSLFDLFYRLLFIQTCDVGLSFVVF